MKKRKMKRMSDPAIKKQMKGVGDYIRYLADHMRLKDWSFDVEFNPQLEQSLATVECIQNRRHAVLAVGPLFLESSPEDQRLAAVHELVHCHLQPTRTFFKTLSKRLGKIHETLEENHDNHLESATDGLAAALAAALPTLDSFPSKS